MELSIIPPQEEGLLLFYISTNHYCMTLLALHSPSLHSMQLKEIADLLITQRQKLIPNIATSRKATCCFLLSPMPFSQAVIPGQLWSPLNRLGIRSGAGIYHSWLKVMASAAVTYPAPPCALPCNLTHKTWTPTCAHESQGTLREGWTHPGHHCRAAIQHCTCLQSLSICVQPRGMTGRASVLWHGA